MSDQITFPNNTLPLMDYQVQSELGIPEWDTQIDEDSPDYSDDLTDETHYWSLSDSDDWDDEVMQQYPEYYVEGEDF